MRHTYIDAREARPITQADLDQIEDEPVYHVHDHTPCGLDTLAILIGLGVGLWTVIILLVAKYLEVQ